MLKFHTPDVRVCETSRQIRFLDKCVLSGLNSSTQPNYSRIVRLDVKISGYYGMAIVWDNNQLVQVIAPSSLKDSLCGLCGTFNDK